MKKLMIAGILIGAPYGAALAQSNVTVYGLLDTGYENLTNAGPNGGTANLISSAGMNNSRLGFRGTEDLGGGMKALFQLESEILSDTGAYNGTLFKRQANVGLEGRWGKLIAGRSFTTTYDFMTTFDPFGFAPRYSWASGGSGSNANSYSMTTGANNLLKYAVETGPFKLGASYSFGEQTSGTADGAKSQLGVIYSTGRLSLVTTVERSNGNNVAAAGGHDKATIIHAGAMYNSGAYKLQLAGRTYKNELANRRLADVRANLYWAGLTYLATPVITLTGATYYQDIKNLAPGTDADPVLYVARFRYALSKRTDLYLTGAYAKAKHGQAVSLSRNDDGYADTQRGIMTGIQHRF